jgi:hypothetical protein
MPGEVIQNYLSDLAVRLPGPARTRMAILAEINDGLADAVEAHTAQGLTPSEAAEAAVTDFGDPIAIGAEFAPVIAAGQAHRYGIGFLVTGPIVGGLWLTTAALIHTPHLSLTVVIAAVVLAVVLAAAVPCAVFAVAATGRASRWLVTRPTTALRAVTITAIGAIVGDASLLLLLATQAATLPGSLATLPAALASAASLTRLTLASHSTRQLILTKATVS